jgi:uncharacterized damage-inducible protein DinB
MTYYSGTDLARAFLTVRNNTVQIAKDIPEESYDFRASPDTRSVRDMLVHIALANSFANAVHRKNISDLTKVNWPEVMERVNAEQAKPRTKADIISLLEEDGADFAGFLAGLDNAFLGEMLAMFPGATPESKSRFEMLLGAKEHEMHHRAQLMLIERMLGIVPHLTRQREERMAQMQAAQAQQAEAKTR